MLSYDRAGLIPHRCADLFGIRPEINQCVGCNLSHGRNLPWRTNIRPVLAAIRIAKHFFHAGIAERSPILRSVIAAQNRTVWLSAETSDSATAATRDRSPSCAWAISNILA